MPGERIVIVTDDASSAQLGTRILTENGYLVQVATSKQEGMARLEAEPIDLLVVDAQIPDGLTVLRRGREINPLLLAVVITDHATLENAFAFLHAGECRLVLKPFGGDELLSMVRDAMERRRNEQEQQRLRAQLPILQVAQALATEGDTGLLAKQLLKMVIHEVPDAQAVLFLLDQEDNLTVAGAIGLLADPRLATWQARWHRRAHELPLTGSEPLPLASPADLPPPVQSLLQLPENAIVVWLPLRTLRRCVGILVLARQPGHSPFSPSEMNLLSIIGGQIATAIENATLYELIGRGKREWEETFDAIADGISIHNTDGCIIRANKALSLRTGTMVRDLVGRRCCQIVHGSSAPPDFCPMPGALTSGRLAEVEVENSLLGGVLLCQVYPLSDKQGRTWGVVHILRDITARKRIEAELRQRNEELAALNSITSAIGQSTDLDKILNATLDRVLEVLQTDGGWIVLQDDGGASQIVQRGVPSEILALLQTMRLTDFPGVQMLQNGETVIVQKGPSEMPMPNILGGGVQMLAGVPIWAGDRRIGTVGVLRYSPHELRPGQIQILSSIGHQLGVAIENALLSRQAAEVRILRELDSLCSELIANVSHEVRTPLGLIKILSTTLLRQDITLDDATWRELLADIVDETEKLEKIVDNLLDLSRMEERRLVLHKERVDMGHLAGEVIENMQSRSTQHRLVADFPPTALIGVADRQRIEQVLYNLLDNALKYSPDGGTITVQGRREGDEIVIRVRDEGIGIPSAELERVFDRFYRIENGLTMRQRGAGLGLAVCRGIIETHGGCIWAESTPGVGSTFVFTLPAEPNTAP